MILKAINDRDVSYKAYSNLKKVLTIKRTWNPRKKDDAMFLDYLGQSWKTRSIVIQK